MRKTLAALALLAGFLPAIATAQAPPAVPALPDTERRTSYALTAGTCPACSVGFALYGTGTDYGNWIEVWIVTGSGSSAVATKLTAVTDYTLSSATGSLATIPRPITNATITLSSARTGTLQIVGAERPRRLTQFPENRGVTARELNVAVTDLVAENREQWDKLNRTLVAAPGDSIGGPIPVAAKRAGGVLGFDSSGNPIALTALTGLGNVIGPNTSVVGNIALWGNTSGTLLLDGGTIGVGDVTGPASAALNQAATFADSTGKLLKNSGLTLTPSTGTFTLTNGKTFSVGFTTTLTGTDGTTFTYPGISDTLVGLTATQTLTNKTLTGPTINGGSISSVSIVVPTISGGTATALTSLGIRSTGSGAFDLILANTENLTAARTLTLTLNNANRTVQLVGNLTLSGDFSTAGSGAIILTAASPTNVTLPTTGTLATLAGAEALTNKTINGLTVTSSTGVLTVANAKTIGLNFTTTFAGTDGTTFNFPTISDTLVGLTATQTVTNKTLTAPTINGGTATALTSLGIRSTGSGAFDLTLANTENLTAGRTLTLTLNNAARTINLSGNLTLAAAFSTAGGNAITMTGVGTTNVTLPVSGTLATTDTANTFSATNTFSALQQFTDLRFSSGKLYPTADSTTAMQVCRSDATTCFVRFDTSNSRVGINKTPGAFDLDTNGAVNVGGVLTFGTLSATSLAASVSTITGLTINNTPNSSNDYLVYYSAADGAIRRCTVGSCAAAATAGVSALNGLTGSLTLAGGAGIAVSSGGSTVTVTSANPAPQGRLTLQSAVPVMRTTQAAKSVVYYSCYAGSGVPYYNGTNDALDTIASCEVSTTLQAASTGVINSGDMFDVWWVNSGANKICVATNGSGGGWAADGGSVTARGSTFTQLNRTARGYYTNAGALAFCYNGSTNYGSVSANRATYLGSFYSTAAGQTSYTFGGSASGGTAGLFGLCNYYNRVTTGTNVIDTGVSYTYTTNAYRQARASAGNQVRIAVCVDEDDVMASYTQRIDTTADAFSAISIAIGLDSTTVPTGQRGFVVTTTAVSAIASAATSVRLLPGVGLHTMYALETGDGTHANTANADNTGTFSVIFRN